MELTKEQRLDYYKKGLALYTDTEFRDGICIALQTALAGDEINIISDDIPDMFPEFLAQKPKYATAYYWWPFGINYKEHRISVLTECIKQLEHGN